MADLRYVCLSDLHLGAGYSILTAIDKKKGAAEPGRPSETLTQLGRNLGAYVAALSGGKPVNLVLMGDVLDMALSPLRKTVPAFRSFMAALYPDDGSGPFAPEVICVPGNHDHHIWRSVRERDYLDRLAKSDGGAPSPADDTVLFGAPTLEALLLQEAVASLPQLKNARFPVAYPNFGLAKGDRAVILHHGHFIESFYRMMSALNEFALGKSQDDLDAAALERQNGTWIDFIWSTFGGTGELGRDVDRFYGILQSGAATHQYISAVAHKLVQQYAGMLPMGGEDKIRGYAEMGTKALLDFIVGRFSELERNQHLDALGQGNIDGLHWYLDHIVLKQIEAEQAKVPKDLTFVFGHTHKPFEDMIAAANYARPIPVYNTGGWVQDEPKSVPREGASAVFIDDDLNTAALRFYNQTPHNTPPAVSVRAAGLMHNVDNPLHTAMEETLADQAAGWADFAKAAKADLELRRDLLRQQLHQPLADFKKLPGTLV